MRIELTLKVAEKKKHKAGGSLKKEQVSARENAEMKTTEQMLYVHYYRTGF